MKVIPFLYNDIEELFSNTYVLVDSLNNCVVIDPSKNNDSILNFIKKNGYNLKAILLTHSHIDHIRGVDILYNEFKCDIYIHYLDKESLYDSRLNLSYFMNEDSSFASPVISLKDGDLIKVLEEDIKLIHTPFHNEGSSCYFLKESKLLFSGDTLFKGSVGRDDFPTSIRRLRKESLDKLMKLDDDVKVYPGHGLFTSIGIERKTNPFVYR